MDEIFTARQHGIMKTFRMSDADRKPMELCPHCEGELETAPNPKKELGAIEAAIIAMIDKAIRAEREACAKIADKWIYGWNDDRRDVAYSIAEEIRGRR